MTDDTRDYLRSGGPGQSGRGSMVGNGVPSTQPIRSQRFGMLFPEKVVKVEDPIEVTFAL